jgi:hypothetical protein
MKFKRLVMSAGFLLISFALVYTVIRAQISNSGISVHPTNFDITAIPGQKASGVITVDNLTAQPIQIRVDLRNFTALGEEGSVTLTTEDTGFSLAKWIKVQPETMLIEPHGSQNFAFTIIAPVNAEPGGHFGSIVFITVPPPDLKGSGASLSQEIGALILYEIPGNAKEQATLESFAADKSFYEFGPVTFGARVKNEGAIHVAPAGSVLVKGWFGQKFLVPLDMRNVLPNAVRRIPATLNRKILIGNYTATLIATYGTKGQQLYASTQFFAFPIRYGVIILIILIILILARRRIGKSLKILLTGK